MTTVFGKEYVENGQRSLGAGNGWLILEAVEITYDTYLLTRPLRSHWNIGPQQLYNY
jgi:hypothetical protein